MQMTKIARSKKTIACSVALIGVVISTALWTQVPVLILDENTGLSGNVGPTIFEELAVRYSLIAASFSVCAALFAFNRRLYLLYLSLMPSTFILIQWRLLDNLKQNVISTNWEFIGWLKVTYYFDYLLLFILGSVIALQISSLCDLHKARSHRFT